MTGQHQTVGDDSVAIQVAGDNVTVSIGAASLTLAQRHRLKAVPSSERELLLTELRGTDLVGRDADLASLRAWLSAPFSHLPRAFAESTGGMVREYLERSEKLGKQPDMTLLEPIIAVFAQLQTQQEDPA